MYKKSKNRIPNARPNDIFNIIFAENLFQFLFISIIFAEK